MKAEVKVITMQTTYNKKAAQPTSKQDGQFMTIQTAQTEQDTDQENMYLPKVQLPASKKRQYKADQTNTKRACTIRVLTTRNTWA